MHPPEGPPSCTALILFPDEPPPPTLFTTSRMVMPMGTSINPPLLIRPARAKTFVPLLFSVPSEAYSFDPFRIIQGTEAKVSTLLIQVGFPHRPDWAGNGGRYLGIPLLPSIEAISAVSSPQTKAPAPSLILIWNEKSVPRMFSPK